MGPRERHSRHRSKTHMLPIVIGSFFGFFLLFCVAFGIGMIGNVNRWLSDLPDYTDADNYMVSEPTSILDANGNEIASLYVQNRESVTYDQISPYVLQGTVSTEDERFYQHNGVDILGIMRAVVVQLTGGSEGASTITQQLGYPGLHRPSPPVAAGAPRAGHRESALCNRSVISRSTAYRSLRAEMLR